MISRLGLAISRVFERTAPDPFVIAIVLMLLTAVLALLCGDFATAENPAPGFRDRTLLLLDSWRGDSGIWRLLSFAMQMCLILVTGHALAVTRPVQALIHGVARVPKSTASAAAMVSAIAACAGVINWGLGLIVGALLAREVGRSLNMRGIRAHYPLIAAAGYTAMLVWHGGLSGSAPLSTTTKDGASKVLPAQYVEALGDSSIPLQDTLFSNLNLFVTVGLLGLVPVMFLLLAPKRAGDMRPIDEFQVTLDSSEPIDDQPPRCMPDYLDRSLIVACLLAIPLLLALWRYGVVSGLSAVGLNEVNATMLALGLILHGSPRSYMAAVEQGARGCAGIIIQFPLYAGIMSMMESANLVQMIAAGMTELGNATTIPIMSLFSAGIVNLFIPSGGGQWAVQGPIALEAGLQAGVSPGTMIMSVAYGDQLTNMLQPFWALPLLAITGTKARDIVGYTAVVMLAAAVWITIGLLLFGG